MNKALIIELENNREELGIQAIEQEEKPLCITNPEPEESKLMKREDSLDEILPEPLAIKNEPEEVTKVKDYGHQDEPNTGWPIYSRASARTKAMSYWEDYSPDWIDELMQENEELKKREKMYKETMKHQKNQIELLKKSQVKLKRDKVKFR